MTHIWIDTKRDGMHFSPTATLVLSITFRSEGGGRALSLRKSDAVYLANGMEVDKHAYLKLFEKIRSSEDSNRLNGV